MCNKSKPLRTPRHLTLFPNVLGGTSSGMTHAGTSPANYVSEITMYKVAASKAPALSGQPNALGRRP